LNLIVRGLKRLGNKTAVTKEIFRKLVEKRRMVKLTISHVFRRFLFLYPLFSHAKLLFSKNC
jgi:hypothetical protein